MERAAGSRAFSTAAAAGFLALAAVGAAAIVAHRTGNFGIPHNDDWSFSLTTLDLLRTGHLHYFDWGQMPLFGQIAVAAPFTAVFGRNESALQASGLVMAAIALVLAYFLARQFATPAISLLTTALLAAFPSFGALSSSYMTDLPALAGQLGCLLAGVSAVRRRSTMWFALSVVLGVWAFSIRQQSLAAIIAVAVIAAREGDRRRRLTVTSIALAAVIGCVAIEVIRRAAPGAQVIPVLPKSAGFIGHVSASIVEMLFSLGLLVLPVVLLRLPQLTAVDRLSVARRAGWAFGVAVSIAFVAEPLTGHGFQLTIGNYLARGSSYSLQSTGLPASMPTWLWVALQVGAAFGGAVLLGEMAEVVIHWRDSVERLRHCDPAKCAVAVFAALYSLVLVVQALPGQHLYDRYALPLVLPAVLLLTSGPHVTTARWRSAAVSGAVSSAVFGVVALAVLTAVSWTLTVATLSRDGAVWHAAQVAERIHGLTARQINAGLAWDGWAAREPADRAAIPSGPAAYPTVSYIQQFPGSQSCAVIVPGVEPSSSDLFATRVIPISGFGLPGESAAVRTYLSPACFHNLGHP